jgi:hypothetical protein
MEEATPMARSMWLSLIVLVVAASASRAVIFLIIDDPVDDYELVDAVSGQKPVKEFAAEIDALKRAVTVDDIDKIEKLFGKPARKPGKDYAMPVAQSRKFWISGIRYADEKMNKDHTEFYPIGDFAGIEVWYGIDGKRPRFALFYFKMDETFPKLKKVEGKDAERPASKGAVTRKHTIDVEHWDKMKEGMNKEQIAELFSAPAGDYAPGTDYPTRSWGWRRGSDGKVAETLEWRSEKGRVVVEFDEKGNFVTSEFYFPGRDPVTNITERLKWDREKFDKVKKYVEERLRKQ